MSEANAGLRRAPLWRLWPGCAQLEPQYPATPLPEWRSPPGLEPLSANSPRISVVVPSYQQGRFLAQTLDSLLGQGYPNLEILLVDGGSTDETLQVIEHYREHLAWWVSEPDQGQAHAINKGMQHATGSILGWLNSDDCLMPGALYRVAAAFAAPGAREVVYGHRVLIDDKGLDIGKWILPGHHQGILSYADYIPQETMFWTRDLWQRTGARIDESYRFAMDWELIRRFVDAKARFQLLPCFLGQFRIHAQQKSTAHIEQVGFEEMERIRTVCRERFSGRRPPQWLYDRWQRLGWWTYIGLARCKELAWSLHLAKID
jgi:glycosyltransferase involved in cell wall biosynthesis